MPDEKEQALIEMLFRNPIEEETEEYQKVQQLDFKKMTDYELEALRDEIDAILQYKEVKTT